MGRAAATCEWRIEEEEGMQEVDMQAECDGRVMALQRCGQGGRDVVEGRTRRWPETEDEDVPSLELGVRSCMMGSL